MSKPYAVVTALTLGLLASCGGSTKTVIVTSANSPTSSSTTSAATASPSTATTSTPAARTIHIATFKSPSANIGCMIIAGTARCDIRHRNWSPPPRPASCPNVVDFGQGLIVGRSGSGRLVCAGDTALDPSARNLPYNADTIVGAFRCLSTTAGVTCTNGDTGHGFFISIGSYRVF